MTYIDIDKAIVDIVKQKCAECKVRLDRASKENPTERKALQLEYGMYTFCGNAGAMINGCDRRKVLEIRHRFLNGVISDYPRLNEAYRKIGGEEKLCFIAALQAELYIRDQWLGTQKAELAAAEASGDLKKAFEFRIKIGSAENMFASWESWRRENNVYPDMFEE